MSQFKRYSFLVFLSILFTVLFLSSFSLKAFADSPQNTSFSISLTSISSDTSSIQAPGKLSIDASFSVPADQIDTASFQFVGNATKNKLYASFMPEYSSEIILDVDSFVLADTYSLSQITISDKSGNTYYFKQNPTPKDLKTFGSLNVQFEFTVENDSEIDTTPPIITAVVADVPEVASAETITLTPTIEETESGLDYATFCFENAATKKRIYITATAENPNPSLTISSYQVPGVYELVEISAADLSGNRVYYVSTYKSSDPSFFKPLPCELSFVVLNNNFETFSQNSETANLTKDIDLLTQNGSIFIDCTGYEEIPSSVFKVAQGTDKTLCFFKDAQIWTIHGKDITDPMDFSLSMKATYPSNDQNSLSITFPKANKFPGKFTVHLALDGNFTTLTENDRIMLYRYNEQSGQQSPGETLSFDSEGYVTFSTAHPSDLIIKKETVKTPVIEPSANNINASNPPTGPLDEVPILLLFTFLSLGSVSFLTIKTKFCKVL